MMTAMTETLPAVLSAIVAVAAIAAVPISITVVAKAFRDLQTVGGQPVDLLRQQNQLTAELQRDANEAQRKLIEERIRARANSLGD